MHYAQQEMKIVTMEQTKRHEPNGLPPPGPKNQIGINNNKNVMAALPAQRYALSTIWKVTNAAAKLHMPDPRILPPRQAPRIRTYHLAFTEPPEIYPQPDQIVDARVGALVQQQGGECAQGVDGKSGFDAAVHCCFGEGEDG